ncbi:MAG TPA: hypothetical protein DCS73_02740 [Roseburia sp.]|nr:hypothetical protein [Roseburia sp.]
MKKKILQCGEKGEFDKRQLSDGGSEMGLLVWKDLLYMRQIAIVIVCIWIIAIEYLIISFYQSDICLLVVYQNKIQDRNTNTRYCLNCVVVRMLN